MLRPTSTPRLISSRGNCTGFRCARTTPRHVGLPAMFAPKLRAHAGREAEKPRTFRHPPPANATAEARRNGADALRRRAVTLADCYLLANVLGDRPPANSRGRRNVGHAAAAGMQRVVYEKRRRGRPQPTSSTFASSPTFRPDTVTKRSAPQGNATSTVFLVGRTCGPLRGNRKLRYITRRSPPAQRRSLQTCFRAGFRHTTRMLHILKLRHLMKSGSMKAGVTLAAIGSAGIQTASMLLSMAVAIVLARSLGTEGYGTYAFAFSIASVVAVPAQIGLPQLLVRELAKYQYRQQWGLMRGILRRSNELVILFSLSLIILAIGILSLSSFPVDSDEGKAFVYALPLIPFMALGALRGAALRGLKRVVEGQVPGMVLRPAFLLVLLSMALLSGSLQPWSAIGLHAVAAVFAFVVAGILLRRYLPIQSMYAQPEYDTQAWLHSMLPLSLVGGMHIVQNQADIVMLGLFASSGEVGVYRAVTQSAALVVFFLTAINLAVGPYISQLYTAGDTERLQLLARNSARLILAFALPVASTFVLFGKEILVFAFGPDYGVGEVPLAMLCGGQIVNAATGPLGMLMNMTGNERDTARGTAVGVLSNILLNLLLIPQFGMNGAAAATAISVLVLNGILCRKLWLRTGICSVAIGVRVGRAKE